MMSMIKITIVIFFNIFFFKEIKTYYEEDDMIPAYIYSKYL